MARKAIIRRVRRDPSPPSRPPRPPVERATERPTGGALPERPARGGTSPAPGGSPVRKDRVFAHLPSESSPEVTDIRKYLEERRRRGGPEYLDLTRGPA